MKTTTGRLERYCLCWGLAQNSFYNGSDDNSAAGYFRRHNAGDEKYVLYVSHFNVVACFVWFAAQHNIKKKTIIKRSSMSKP